MGRGELGGVIFPKCCCCIDLKTGVVVLGILSAIATENAMIVYAVLGGLGALLLGNSAQAASHNSRFDTVLSMMAMKTTEAIVGAIFSFMFLISSILLSVGASKEKPNLLIPWMIMSLLGIVYCIITIVLAFVMPLNPQTFPTATLISNLFTIVLTIYSEIVVLSLYNKFKNYSPVRQNI